MTQVIYLFQIIFLLLDIYMVWQARLAINGLTSTLILLFALLIIRRMDDMGRNPEVIGILVLSSVIVTLVTFSIFRVYRKRGIYAAYLERRKEREEDLENMRAESEQ